MYRLNFEYVYEIHCRYFNTLTWYPAFIKWMGIPGCLLTQVLKTSRFQQVTWSPPTSTHLHLPLVNPIKPFSWLPLKWSQVAVLPQCSLYCPDPDPVPLGRKGRGKPETWKINEVQSHEWYNDWHLVSYVSYKLYSPIPTIFFCQTYRRVHHTWTYNMLGLGSESKKDVPLSGVSLVNYMTVSCWELWTLTNFTHTAHTLSSKRVGCSRNRPW